MTQQQQTALNTYGLTGLGYLILMDRYALKKRGEANEGDLVIAILNNDAKDMGQKRELGFVVGRDGDTVSVKLVTSEETINLPLALIEKPLETDPKQIMQRVAHGIASAETTVEKQDEWQSKFEWLLDDWKFVPGGRILTSAGTEQELSFYNCFVVPSPHDSRGGIMKTLTQMTEIMSRGGGVGINISTLRPQNAQVMGVNGRSSGSVSWGGLYSFVTGLIEQGGSRRGALILILNDWHPDVFKFISSKRTSGKITNANISVGLSDKFMSILKDDGMWQLKFPDTKFAAYNDEWIGDMEEWEAKGYPVVVHQEIKASEIWDAIIESAHASAEPGLWFRERSNKMANSYYYPQGKLISTNPCVTGDTLIYTNKGLTSAKKLYDTQQEIKVAIDDRFNVATMLDASNVFYTGKKPVYELKTTTGHSIKATENHKIMTITGWQELKDLQIGDFVHVMNTEGGFGSTGNLQDGRILGWLVGDGYFGEENATLAFYDEEKKELAPMFLEYVKDAIKFEQKTTRKYAPIQIRNETKQRSTVSSVRLNRIVNNYGIIKGNKHIVPDSVFEGTREMQVGFLQALFEADGTVQSASKQRNSIRLAQSNEKLLQQVQILLSNFGIYSKIYKRRNEGIKMLPDSNRELKGYVCKSQFELIISKADMIIFSEQIGFISTRKIDKLKSVLDSYTRFPYKTSYTSQVESINYIGEEDVYDLIQPDTHSFVANGIVVHNCGEIPLAAWAVCNLGAINLGKMYNEVSQDLDEGLLRKTTEYATRFLDNVIDKTPYFIKENEIQQKGERKIGLGIMGLAELLIKMKTRYGSDDGAALTNRIFKIIAEESYITSSKIAAEKGSFPFYDEEKFMESGYMQHMLQHGSTEVAASILENGMRNVTLLTVAPTGTTGTLVNTSTGIEPYFNWVYYRKGRLGLHEEKVPIVNNWLDEQRIDPKSKYTLPDYFATAMELTPKEHVVMQAAAQKWVDNSISKTINAPNDYTIEQTKELYQMLYDSGCKGGTIYRDGSRDEQVLTLKKDELKEEAVTSTAFIQTESTEEMKKILESAVTTIANTLPNSSVKTIYTVPSEIFSLSTKAKGLVIEKRGAHLAGQTFKGITPYGNVLITVNEDTNGNPVEVLIMIAKSGSDLAAQAESTGRLISSSLQMQNTENRLAALKEFIAQMRGIGGSRQVGFGINRVTSFPDAVAKIIADQYVKPHEIEMEAAGYSSSPIQVEDKGVPDVPIYSASLALDPAVSTNLTTTTMMTGDSQSYSVTASSNGHSASHNGKTGAIKMGFADLCPECQNQTLLRQDGCKKCEICGYSEC